MKTLSMSLEACLLQIHDKEKTKHLVEIYKIQFKIHVPKYY